MSNKGGYVHFNSCGVCFYRFPLFLSCPKTPRLSQFVRAFARLIFPIRTRRTPSLNNHTKQPLSAFSVCLIIPYKHKTCQYKIKISFIGSCGFCRDWLEFLSLTRGHTWRWRFREAKYNRLPLDKTP
jgi:hypothetical protein